MNLFHWDKLNRGWDQIQQTWKCLYVTTGGLSVVVFNIAFVQEVKVPTSLLSAATTVLSRSHFRNENYVLIHFQYNEFKIKASDIENLPCLFRRFLPWLWSGRSWYSRASGDILKLLLIHISWMHFMCILIIVSESYYWIMSNFLLYRWCSTLALCPVESLFE